MDDADGRAQQRIELSVSEPSELRPLAEWLRAADGVRVARVAGTPRAGGLGTLDVLVVLASSGGVVAAIRVLPEFFRSRRSGLSITMTVKDKPFTLNATNVDDVMPILERLLDE